MKKYTFFIALLYTILLNSCSPVGESPSDAGVLKETSQETYNSSTEEKSGLSSSSYQEYSYMGTAEDGVSVSSELEKGTKGRNGKKSSNHKKRAPSYNEAQRILDSLFSSVEPTSAGIVDPVNTETSSIDKANLFYNHPKEAFLDESFVLEFVISKDDSFEPSWVVGEDRVSVSDSIKAGKYIKVDLVSSSKEFLVKEVHPSEFALDPKESFKCKWKVTPLKKGTHSIHLTVVSYTSENGSGMGKKIVDSYDAKIKVKVKTRDLILGFLYDFWAWLFTGIITPIILAFILKKKKLND
jgi:hypothetical protein